KVVNPPSTPVPRNGRTSGCAARISVIRTISTPIAAQPATFTDQVGHGNAPGGTGHASDAPYRAHAPTAPPAVITASSRTGTRRRRVAARTSASGPVGATAACPTASPPPPYRYATRASRHDSSQVGTVGGTLPRFGNGGPHRRAATRSRRRHTVPVPGSPRDRPPVGCRNRPAARSATAADDASNSRSSDATPACPGPWGHGPESPGAYPRCGQRGGLPAARASPSRWYTYAGRSSTSS